MNKNKSGFISMTLVYTFLIIFLFLMLAILRTYNEKDKFLEAIDAQISEDISSNVKTKVTVINRILEDNSPINEEDVPIRFINIANSHFGNGNGLYYSENINMSDENDDGKTSRMYYFRGNTERNHIVFAGYCWRIIRTNEDGSIRIRFDGNYSGKKCKTIDGNENNTGITIGKSKYVESDDTMTSADSLKFSNSSIREVLDEWYRENLVIEEHSGQGDFFSLKVADELFCNDTYDLIDRDGVVNIGRLASQMLVPSFIDKTDNNIYNLNNISNTLTFKCNLRKDDSGNLYSTLEDSYSVSGDGQSRLYYPIGLLTAQDVVLAGGYLSNDLDEYHGGRNGMNNESYYMYTGFNYWTMSPYSNIDDVPKMVYVNSNGKLSSANVKSNTEMYIIPVISLKSTITIASGHGTANDPYIVK